MLIFVYLFTNSLFLAKYLSRLTDLYPHLIIPYLIILLTLFSFSEKINKRFSTRFLYLSISFATSLLLFLLMHQFNPRDFRIGRYPALLEWLTRFLRGIFPYGGPTRPSGFPFLFLLALPFYLLGDLGVLQIFGFLLFAFILSSKEGRFFSLLLLILSPSFLFEVITRSELFTNMTLVLGYLLLFQKKELAIKKRYSFLYGLLGGLLLATRGIVLFSYLLFFPSHFKGEEKKGIIFLSGLALAFLAVNLPFFLWDADSFIRNGPFSIQTGYLPSLLLPIFFLSALILGLNWKKEKEPYGIIALFLFLIVFLAFLLVIIESGFYPALWGSQFDISYFIFPLPFLLYAISDKKIFNHPFPLPA
ncbi:MAG: hypothetical protein ABIK99_04490 [candidate division WOR-3 bacterium]